MIKRKKLKKTRTMEWKFIVKWYDDILILHQR